MHDIVILWQHIMVSTCIIIEGMVYTGFDHALAIKLYNNNNTPPSLVGCTEVGGRDRYGCVVEEGWWWWWSVLKYYMVGVVRGQRS